MQHVYVHVHAHEVHELAACIMVESCEIAVCNNSVIVNNGCFFISCFSVHTCRTHPSAYLRTAAAIKLPVSLIRYF